MAPVLDSAACTSLYLHVTSRRQHLITSIDLEQARQEIATFLTEDIKGLVALREGQRSRRAPFRTIRDAEGRCIGAHTDRLSHQAADRPGRQGRRKRLTLPGYCRLDTPLPPHVLPNLGPAEIQAIAYPHFGYGLFSAYAGRGLGMAAARAMVEYSKEWIEDGYLGTVRDLFP